MEDNIKVNHSWDSSTKMRNTMRKDAIDGKVIERKDNDQFAKFVKMKS